MSEMGLALSTALDEHLAPRDAERVAVRYSLDARKLLEDFASTNPIKPGQSGEESFDSAMALFGRRDQTLFLGARDALGVQNRAQTGGTSGRRGPEAAGAAGAAGGAASGKKESACLRHASSSCNASKACQHSHICPFCAGAECGSRPGYMKFHLGKLRHPLALVPAGQRGRSRSRSRSRGRGRSWGRGRGGHQKQIKRERTRSRRD